MLSELAETNVKQPIWAAKQFYNILIVQLPKKINCMSTHN